MARQELGLKKVLRLRKETGLDIIAVLVRGGTEHRRDLCLRDGTIICMWPDGDIIPSEYTHCVPCPPELELGKAIAAPPSLPGGEALGGACTEASERRRGEWVGTLSGAIASALWYQSTLRHGLFTPTDFARLCEPVIRRVLNEVGVANELPATKPSPQGDSPAGSPHGPRPEATGEDCRHFWSIPNADGIVECLWCRRRRRASANGARGAGTEPSSPTREENP